MKYSEYIRERKEVETDFFLARKSVEENNLDLALQYAKQGLQALEELSKQDVGDVWDELASDMKAIDEWANA